MLRLVTVLAAVGGVSLIYPVALVYVVLLEAPHEALLNSFLRTPYFDQFIGIVMACVLVVHFLVRRGLRISSILLIYLGLFVSLFFGLGMDLFYQDVETGGLMILVNWFGLFLMALYISNFLEGSHYDVAKHFLIGVFTVSTALVLLVYYRLLGSEEYVFLGLEMVSGVRYDFPRLQGFLSNSNGFASFYCLLVPWTLFQAWAVRNRYLRIYMLLAAVLFGWATFLTVSRSAILAVPSSIALAGFMVFVHRMELRWLQTATLLGMGLLVVLIGLFGVFYVTVVEGYYLDQSQIIGWNEKIRLYTSAVELLLKNPFGVGLGEFREAIYYYGNPRSPNPHNTYLAVGGMSGLIGLGLIVWFVAAQLSTAARHALRRGSGRVNYEYLSYFAGFLAFWFHNFFHTVIRTSFFWVLLGFFLAYLYREKGAGFLTIGTPSEEP